jgi:hypothetical protein
MKLIGRFLTITLLMVTMFSVAGVASAGQCIQNKNTLHNLVGLDSKAGNLFVSLNSPNKECGCTHARFKAVETDTKMALSILMVAKMSDRTVRIDFLDDTDCNSAWRVYLEK